MKVAKDNDEVRQLFDAIALLEQMAQSNSLLTEEQKCQVEQNFKWYMESIKK